MTIRQKFDNTGYSSPFTISVIKEYQQNPNKTQDQEGEYTMPPSLVEILI